MSEIHRKPPTIGEIIDSLPLPTYHETPLPVKCDHDWPEGDNGPEDGACCKKCGMSFMRYIHTECP